jgi:DNA-binding GntR family transcriptional regulator
MRFFVADEMYELIGNMEQGYVLRAEGNADKELMDEIDEIYRRLIPALFKGIVDRIRRDPEAFIRFED